MQYDRHLANTTQLSQHFALSEFACSCHACEIIFVAPALVSLLEAIRRNFGRPVRITSAYRCPAHNATIPGSSNRSQHMLGTAADIQVALISPPTVQAYCDQLAVPGLGRYQNFTHLDVRDTKLARWAG